MCKLCNTDSLPIKKLKSSNRSEHLFLFINMVYDYTLEHPCRKCLDAFRTYKKSHPETNVDDYIFWERLRKSYTKDFNSTMMCKKVRKYRYGFIKKAFPRKYITIEFGIYKVTQNGNISFVSALSGKNKTFRTLKEAQKYKMSLGNPQRKPVIGIASYSKEMVEKYITKITNERSKKITYMVFIRNKKLKTSKTFNTLEEAQQHKKDITCQQQMI